MSVKHTQRKQGKLRVVMLCNEITAYTLKMICKEDLFPKKSRWLLAGKIADLVNDFQTSVNVANEIRVDSTPDAIERLHRERMAISYLYAVESKIELAIDMYQINEDNFEHWAGLVNEELKLLTGWLTADTKRYSDFLSSSLEDC